MLPPQPFYRPLRQLPLEVNSRGSLVDLPIYCETYKAQAKIEDASTLVLIYFAPVTERSSHGGARAMMCINEKLYRGVPVTMINVSPHLTRTGVNSFTVWNYHIPKVASVRIVEAAKVAEDEMLRSLDESAPYAIRREDTATLVKAYFAEADETVVENFQVSLVCPLAKRKIRVPCRGARCCHVQCFDAYAYLALNEDTLHPSWSCPVCNDQVLLEDMRVDLFTLDILRKAGDQCVAVMLQPDGSWVQATGYDDHSIITIEDSLVEETNGTLRDLSVIDLTIDSD